MPQIWPMNWLILFMFFIITFLVFLSVFYFNMSLETNHQSSSSSSYNPVSLNWKW
uniref:ATP synthase complex subunit 8 n=1 Tax=Simocephalus vetulus TaxID=77651 RepID=A0A7L7S8T9_9CRUS|nr:ATP synthase F0 subunit 8 [Simocephalus vetulus]